MSTQYSAPKALPKFWNALLFPNCTLTVPLLRLHLKEGCSSRGSKGTPFPGFHPWACSGGSTPVLAATEAFSDEDTCPT